MCGSCTSKAVTSNYVEVYFEIHRDRSQDQECREGGGTILSYGFQKGNRIPTPGLRNHFSLTTTTCAKKVIIFGGQPGHSLQSFPSIFPPLRQCFNFYFILQNLSVFVKIEDNISINCCSVSSKLIQESSEKPGVLMGKNRDFAYM